MYKCIDRGRSLFKSNKNMIRKYILVKWPESQELYCHKRFSECYHLVEGEDDFMVPEDLYNEIFMKDF